MMSARVDENVVTLVLVATMLDIWRAYDDDDDDDDDNDKDNDEYKASEKRVSVRETSGLLPSSLPLALNTYLNWMQYPPTR
jgi:hypothetical protein